MKKKINFTLICLFIGLLFISLSILRAEDWPCWRGVNSNGISRETGWNPESLLNGDNVLWTVNVGQGHSAVSIKDGRLYTQGSRVITSDGKDIFEESVHCLNALSGKELWSFTYPSEEMAQ
ncbi:MAG: hypothetical protein MUP70_04065, partial [Candidatus Aminicenantes bacterium]|nr:hypothetical protein [Candidatus Aminicenantes bacterium]